MKRLILVMTLAISLSGCSWMSNNSDDDTQSSSKDRISDTDILSENDVRLIEVSVDNRKWIDVESPCPMAAQVGDNSCGVQVTP